MTQPSIDELKRMALETFGRVLTDQQAEAYRGRLPVLVATAKLLDEWQGRLGETEPAAVYSSHGEGDTG